MDSTSGQSTRTERGSEQAASTRTRLLDSAAELIAEQGWARVTTRAVAERAELPHGTVSYHFRGKQELLRQASVHVIERAIGEAQELFAATSSTAEALPIMRKLLQAPAVRDPVVTGVIMETLREAERDTQLREWMATMLRDYREQVAALVRRDQEAGTVSADIDSTGLAALVLAAADGLFLHSLLDTSLDVDAATGSLLTLLGGADQTG